MERNKVQVIVKLNLVVTMVYFTEQSLKLLIVCHLIQLCFVFAFFCIVLMLDSLFSLLELI